MRPMPAATSRDKFPPRNASAPRRSTVTISVAVPGTVPDVTNMSLDDAKRAIGASGYTVGNVAVTSDGPDGKVARTEPEAGRAAAAGRSGHDLLSRPGALMRILGVDPGLRTTGYGIVDAEGATFRLVEGGVLRPKTTLVARRTPRPAARGDSGSRAQRRGPTAWSLKNCGPRRNTRRRRC